MKALQSEAFILTMGNERNDNVGNIKDPSLKSFLFAAKFEYLLVVFAISAAASRLSHLHLTIQILSS